MPEQPSLHDDVVAELQAEPGLGANYIHVVTSDGTVSLSGSVESHFEKALAEAVVLRIAGVRGVANDLVVERPIPSRRPDAEIAEAAAPMR